MGKLGKRKTRLIFETLDQVFERGNREVVVEARPFHAAVRLKGTRTTYTLPWSTIFQLAVRAELARRKAEREKAKKEKRA